jgi:thymidylate synthase
MVIANTVPSFSSNDEIQHWTLETLLERGEVARPRGLETLELFPVSLVLNNPRRRRVLNPVRKWSFPLALGEFCWHVSGSNAVDFIEYYAPQWREFTDDGQTIRGSCYGHRIFTPGIGGINQWERLIRILQNDQHSRRAVLYFSDSRSVFTDSSKDVPCATTLQFVIRSDRLHAIAQMRSNDAIWGLPYDIFLFTMLQELLACELGLEVGTYSHCVASLHLYQPHFELARKILDGPLFPSAEMPKMESQEQLSLFLALEERLRRGEEESAAAVHSLSPYWRRLFSVLEDYRLQKTRRDRGKELLIKSDRKHKRLMEAISSLDSRLRHKGQATS